MLDSIAISAADPLAEYLAHQAAIDEAVKRVLVGGRYILGPEVSAFEEEFAFFLGAEFAIGVGSGTDALCLSLLAGGIGSGDTVVTVSHTAVATVAAIERIGAEPLLLDIDPSTYTLDPNQLESCLKRNASHRIKAIVPVHLYGHPADLPSILGIAQERELLVIEDCAQSHGAVLRGKTTGTWGHMAAFSFYPTKNLGALGDGGAVVTADPILAEKVRLIREYGWRQRYVSEIAGTNSRLDELQAAILRVKLPHLAPGNMVRRARAQAYTSVLNATSMVLPVCRSDAEHAYHQYVVRTRDRDDLREFLAGHSVGTQIHYPIPIHLQPAYRGRIAMYPQSLPHTEGAAKEVLSLPIHPQLTDLQVRRVGDLIVSWHQRRSEQPG